MDEQPPDDCRGQSKTTLGSPTWFVFVECEGDRTCFLCADITERDTVTLREIYSDAPVDLEHVEEAQGVIMTLREEGIIRFEDATIQWEHAQLANNPILPQTGRE